MFCLQYTVPTAPLYRQHLFLTYDLTLRAKVFPGSIKMYISTIYIIPPHWHDTSSWNPSSHKTSTCLFYRVNIMCVDVLAMQVARAWATMIFTMLTQNNSAPSWVDNNNLIYSSVSPHGGKTIHHRGSSPGRAIFDIVQYRATWSTGWQIPILFGFGNFAWVVSFHFMAVEFRWVMHLPKLLHFFSGWYIIAACISILVKVRCQIHSTLI